MLLYGISAGRVKRVLSKPKRAELGIAPETNAAMQPGTNRRRPEEIWVMYQSAKLVTKNHKHKLTRATPMLIISVWRYPGISKVGAPVPIPEDALSDLEKIR
jgi:hypothetical protein